MQLTCLIVSTLLIAYISQHSTNGLPIEDTTATYLCVNGFKLVDGQCRSNSPLPQKSDVESNPSEFQNINLSTEGTTEENEKLSKLGSCPEGKIRGKSGLCEYIVLEDQLATTLQSKKLDDTPIEHDNEPLIHTTQTVEVERTPEIQKDQPVEHDNEPLIHTTQTVEVEHKPEIQKDEQWIQTTESVKVEHKPEVQKDELVEHEDEPINLTTESVEVERKPVKGERKRKPEVQKDELVEHEDEPLTHTTESVEVDRKPVKGDRKLVKGERKSTDHKDEPVEDEHESSGVNGENSDTPKGCPPGTKADEQGACQDEGEFISTTRKMNLKDLLSKDGSCPSGMELYKKKCVYIKSKENALILDSTNFEEKKSDINNLNDKVVPLLKDDLCPPGTEYYSNGLCRERVAVSLPEIVIVKIKCQANEILLDGKCAPKEIQLVKTNKIVLKSKPSTEDEDKSVEDQ